MESCLMIATNFQEQLTVAMEAAFPLADERVSDLYAMAEYHLGWRNEKLELEKSDSGKLIRPRLCVISGKLVGADPAKVMPLAAAIQLLHDHLLVLDDIQDRSDYRRGRRTVWSIWGEALAINVVEALGALSRRALHQLPDMGIPAQTTLEVMYRLETTLLKIIEGQQMDLSYEKRLDLDENDYLKMIERKTATLIAASASLGALAGGGAAETIQILEDYGLALGLAFQIQDDILDIWGKPDQTGKSLAMDLYRKKKSLPVVYTLARVRGEDRNILFSMYSKPQITDTDVALILEFMNNCEARQYAEELALQHTANAQKALDLLSHGNAEAVRELQEILERLLHRNR
jgi:geranylgeranyl diphosphate synthase, type I